MVSGLLERLAPVAALAPAGAAVGGVALDDLALSALGADAAGTYDAAAGLRFGGRVAGLGLRGAAGGRCGCGLGGGDEAVRVVGQHLQHEGLHHVLHFVDELLRAVFVALNLSELALPQSREFSTLEQFVVNEGNEFLARVGG